MGTLDEHVQEWLLPVDLWGHHYWLEDPMYGCQIGSKYPIVHVKLDQECPIQSVAHAFLVAQDNVVVCPTTPFMSMDPQENVPGSKRYASFKISTASELLAVGAQTALAEAPTRTPVKAEDPP
jgi:hypothetical protein